MDTQQHVGEAPKKMATRWRPARRLAVELLVVLLLVAVFVPWNSLMTRVRDDSLPPRSLAYVQLSGDVSDSPWEIAAFDEETGAVVARVPTAHQPMVLPHPSGEQLYLVETRWDHAMQGTVSLSLMDTATWTRHTTVTIEHAPLALALSPDRTNLLVRTTNMLGDYWLDVYDARTLERPSGEQRVDLPRGCGAGWLVPTANEVALVCGGVTESGPDGVAARPLAVLFIDPAEMQITANVLMDGGGILRSGRVAGIATPADGTSLYVVFTNLQMLEIDASTHEIVPNVRTYSTFDQKVITVASVADDALLVAVRDALVVGTFAQLRRFALPTLEELPAPSLPDGPRFAPGAHGTLYRWQSESTDFTVRTLADGSERVVSLGATLPNVITVLRSDSR